MIAPISQVGTLRPTPTQHLRSHDEKAEVPAFKTGQSALCVDSCPLWLPDLHP